MGKYRKLGKNVILLTAGNFASKLLSFFLVPFYTAILSTEEYGTADMITTSVNLIMPIFTILIYEAVMRYALDDKSDKKQVISIGLYTTIIGGLVVVCGGQVLRLFDTFKDYVWLFILYYLSLAFYNLVLQFVKGIENVGIYSVAGVMNTFIYIICNILFLLFFHMKVEGYLLAFVIGNFVSALYAFFSAEVYRYIVGIKKVRMSYFKQMARYSIPMIPNAISWWISNSSDKYILIYFWGVSLNGIYSVSYKIPSILTIVINIFISAWQISAVEDFGSEESKKFYEDIYNKYESLLFCGSVVLIGMVKILAGFLFSDAFFEAWLFTPVLVCASVFSSLAAFYGSIYTSAKKTSMLFYSTLIGAVGNIILNFALIPFTGAMGAAIATMISYILVWIIRAINSRKILSFKINIKRDVLMYFILAAEVIFICFDFNPYYIISLLAIVLSLFVCRDTLTDLFKLVIRKFVKKDVKNM